MSKKNKNELTYFLDHPQIKRYPSPGNGNAPVLKEGSIGEKINFGGKNTKPQQDRVVATQASNPKPTTSTATKSLFGAIRKGFKGN